MNSTQPSGPLEDSSAALTESHIEITRVADEFYPPTLDAQQMALEGAAEESESTADTDSLSEEVTGVKWADEVDKQPQPSAPALVSPPRPPPPALPQSDALSALEKKHSVLSDRVRTVEHQYLQLNDVLVRFQMMLDQSMGRTDDALQHVAAYQAKSRSVTNELRSQMSAVIQLVGKSEVQGAINAAAEEAKAQPQFRTNSASRFNNSRQAPPADQQQYASTGVEQQQPAWQQRSNTNDGSGGGWQQRGVNTEYPPRSGGGNNGYHQRGNSGSWQQRGGRGGSRGSRHGYEN